MKDEFDPLDTKGQKLTRDKRLLEEKTSQDHEDDDLKWLMNSRRGRKVVWGILERAGVYRVSFSINALEMAFAEGRKNEGLRTLDRIHTVCPQLYAPMIKEANERRNNND